MVAQCLLIVGSLILLLLGTIHLLYTFFTPKFDPRHGTTKEYMVQDTPVLTRETTMWRAWVGFNASHSIGAIFIGSSTLILATQYLDLYTHSVALPLLTIGTSLSYVFLAKRYWFRIPFVGLLIATGCFISSWLLSR
ncbi:hypothetical protein [Hymenobacter sp. BT730]|uniref:LIC_13387 family protein n=1 Tax=Hymenobacter sp. BT730 TaxID=3063332 RepID=UPI0026DFFFBF|nr:hypothetical protein [Hymenobacter sp. BT730]